MTWHVLAIAWRTCTADRIDGIAPCTMRMIIRLGQSLGSYHDRRRRRRKLLIGQGRREEKILNFHFELLNQNTKTYMLVYLIQYNAKYLSK